jgi:hypothetical protein
MSSTSLTNHDLFILEKIKDPESGPSAPVLIDPSLPRDPHITDDATYHHITKSERGIISSIQDVELQIANLKPAVSDPLAQYLSCVARLDELVEEYPEYASARNNRAQALRRIYGDGLLVKGDERAKSTDEAVPLDPEASDQDLMTASYTILEDLSMAIKLLMPATLFMAISCKLISEYYFPNPNPMYPRNWDITLHSPNPTSRFQTLPNNPQSTSSQNPLPSLHPARSALPPNRQAPLHAEHGAAHRPRQARSAMVCRRLRGERIEGFHAGWEVRE